MNDGLAKKRASLREILADILFELRALREAVEDARAPTRALRIKDRNAMARILPVLAAHFRGTFAVWELVDAAGARDATAANLRLVLGKRTAQQLGKLFQRVQDQDIGGIRIHRAGQDGNGAVWECIGNGLP